VQENDKNNPVLSDKFKVLDRHQDDSERDADEMPTF